MIARGKNAYGMLKTHVENIVSEDGTLKLTCLPNVDLLRRICRANTHYKIGGPLRSGYSQF